MSRGRPSRLVAVRPLVLPLALGLVLVGAVGCDPLEPAPHPPLPGPLAGQEEGTAAGTGEANAATLPDPGPDLGQLASLGPGGSEPGASGAEDAGQEEEAPGPQGSGLGVSPPGVGDGADADGLSPATSMSTMLFGTPDLTATPPVPRGHALREIFHPGQQLRRSVRVERRYRLRVESNLMANAEGASELTREYEVVIGETDGSRIDSAAIRILGDERRILPVGEVRPRNDVEPGPLQRASLACEPEGSGYRCEGRDVRTDSELIGVYPQRTLLAAPELVHPGDDWELSPEDARAFLGVDTGEVEVRFAYVEAGVPFRDELCRRVTYTLEGEIPLPVFGETMIGRLTGSGEYLLCQPDQVILNHHQERHLEVAGTVQRLGRGTPVERREDLFLEEETFAAPPP